MKNILLVDDDRSVLRLIASVLRSRYEVRKAEDGATAVLLSSARRPDLVMLDVHMRGADGLETLRGLLRLDPTLRVVMASGDDSPDLVALALGGGAMAYLTKPFSLDELDGMVEGVLALDRH